MPSLVKLYEVGPRDGLQGVPPIPATAKIRYIDLLSESGLRYIEITSFVDPRRVPQMADATDVARGIRKREGVAYSALAPNEHGYQRAAAAGLDEVAVFLSANEDHHRSNLGRPLSETMQRLEPVIARGIADGKRVRGYVSTVWGYHRPDDTPLAGVTRLARWLHDCGVYELSLGDTEGMATPPSVRERLRAIADEVPISKLGLHYHARGDVRPLVDAGYEAGVRTFDGATGGIGGCPTDPLLPNTDTRVLEWHFRSLQVPTDVDHPEKLEEAARFVRQLIAA